MAVVGYARIAAPPPALHCLLILVAATEAAAWGTVYPPLAPLSHATIAQRVNLVHRGQHVPALRSLSMRAPPLRVHASKMGINPTEYLQDNGQECNASGGSMVSWRRELIKAVLALPLLPVSESFAASIAAPSAGMIPGRTATNSEAPKAPKVTQRVFVDVRIIKSYDVEVLEDAALRGRMVFGLFGDAAPKGTSKFLDFVRGSAGQFRDGDGPSYRSSGFEKLRPNVLVEGGRITGLDLTPFAGQLEYQYRSRLLPLRPVLEVSDVKHNRRGLLTRKTFNAGPEFGITLAPAPSKISTEFGSSYVLWTKLYLTGRGATFSVQLSLTPMLDGTWEVIGQLEQGDDLLREIEDLPYISGKSLEEPGSITDQIFQAQRSFFMTLSKGVGDSRAADRTGQLLRRVEITNCGLL